MHATRFLLSAIAAEGVDHFFLAPNAPVTPLPSGTSPLPPLLVTASHEAGAAFMADGYARASGLFGVCLASGGPAAMANLVPAAVAARTAASPVFYLTWAAATPPSVVTASEQDPLSRFLDVFATVDDPNLLPPPVAGLPDPDARRPPDTGATASGPGQFPGPR